jgi:hypothetical protein
VARHNELLRIVNDWQKSYGEQAVELRQARAACDLAGWTIRVLGTENIGPPTCIGTYCPTVTNRFCTPGLMPAALRAREKTAPGETARSRFLCRFKLVVAFVLREAQPQMLLRIGHPP